MPEQHSVHSRGSGGTVSNSVTGHVGSLIQAGDVYGGIDMRGPGPALIQTGPANPASAPQVQVPLPSDLVTDMAEFLQRVSSADLGRRSTDADRLHQRLAQATVR
ncbi:MAG TPA: hypothetical protein VL551_10580 [Actinospica sp.]|jgi:hypothetical protein|nr:hypothetical protein [Actinospica sp.]